MLKEKKTTI